MQESENFEKEFTQMAIYSVDEGATNAGAASAAMGNAGTSETFLNFTFEEESFLDSLREERFSQSSATGRK